MSKIKSHFDREIQGKVRQALNNAKYSIRVAMYSLNEDSLFRLLCHKAEKDDIQVEIILDTKQYEENEIRLSSSIVRLENSGGSVFLYKSDNGSYANMHHKFCIIDDKILITGSYNWTNNATNFSDENIVIIDDFPTSFEFGQKFNQLKKGAKSHNENADLPIFLTTSKNVVKENEEVEISWRVPNAETLTLNDDIIENSGTIIKRIEKNERFRISALGNGNAASKTVSVTIAEKPVIKIFTSNERVIRRGQSVILSWEVKGATKVQIQQLGEVADKGTRECSPQEDTTYKLIAYDIWDEQLTKELIVRVPDFKIPTVEKIVVKLPQINSTVRLEIKKPNFSQSITRDTINEIINEQKAIVEEGNNQINQEKANQTAFLKELRKSIKEKSTQIRINRIKEKVFESTETILTQMLTKLRESR